MLGVWTGCSGGGGAAATEGSTAAEPDTSGVACESADDCVLVEDCCGCAAGGTKMAVHNDELQQTLRRESDACADRQCGSEPSDDPSCEATAARCEDGRCVPAI